MQSTIFGRAWFRVILLSAIAVGILSPANCPAIVVGLLDNFQTGSAPEWGYMGIGGAQNLTPSDVVLNAGPNGMGDHALFMDTNIHGGGRLLVNNQTSWIGDWTTAGVTQVSLDVRNPTASPLSMRIGIAGPGGVGSFGNGDTHITGAIAVAADNAWHSITFDVLPGSFTSLNGNSITAALAGVTSVRILSSAAAAFTGQNGGAFYLDNILTIGAEEAVDGDYNGNDLVDAADYPLWRDTVGQSGDDLPADGDGNLTVNSADYAHWKARFGNDSGSGAGEAENSLAIPEPAAAALALMMLLVAGMWRWFDLRAADDRG